MSKPIQAINRYKADLRELNFLLFEQFKVNELLGKAPFEAWGEDEMKTSLVECYRWAREVIGPLNAIGDTQGCRLEAGHVTTPSGFKAAWKSLYESGWKSIAVDQEFGGAGSPHSLQVLIEEIISGANTAFSMYPGLAHGASEVIESFGTHDQKQLYCTRMYSGAWGGTMCLTEPHAGSDVGAARTSAKKNADGSYSITGTKIFISGGEHDLADNIVHLVLARTEGAPAGTKGLTLFIVPKLRASQDGTVGESNDVSCGAIEHKMGINGNATCVLNFGENGKCVGWPVGGDAKLNQGMSQMFKMMNGARIGVGVQGISVASSAFLNALEYAKDRKQGASIEHWKDATAPRARIIEHADVRRMLLDMKSRVEGIRALAVKLTNHQDCVRALTGKDDTLAAYHQGQVDLLVPLVKAYGSDQAFRVCETAIQTFLGDIGKFVAANSGHAKLGAAAKRLGAAQEALGASTMKLLTWFQTGNMTLVPLYANRFLEMMSETSVAWMLLEGAVIADAKLATLPATEPDHAFYSGKVAAALYFARTVLPGVEHKAAAMGDEDRSPIDLAEAGFATV